MQKTTPENKKRYTIMVGSKDSNSRKQKQHWIRIVKLVHECCKESGNAYTTQICKGGYYHDDGEFVLESSMQICLIEPKEDTVDEIAGKLCELLNQESVLVCVDEVTSYSLCKE